MTEESPEKLTEEAFFKILEEKNLIAEKWEDSAQGKRELEHDKGYYGTLSGYLEWIQNTLMMGGFVLGEPVDHEHYKDEKYRELKLITGGFSTDERLLNKVWTSLLSTFWVSLSAGGLYVYHIRESWLNSEEETQWLKPTTDVFENVYRARTIRLYDENGEFFEVKAPYGAELSFTEDKNLRWTPQENGLLSIRAISEDPWKS